MRNEQHAYATNQHPTAEAMRIARAVLAGTIADPTGGATHFYSPISMPAEGQDTTGYDVWGLEQVNGLGHRNYAPRWAEGR